MSIPTTAGGLSVRRCVEIYTTATQPEVSGTLLLETKLSEREANHSSIYSSEGYTLERIWLPSSVKGKSKIYRRRGHEVPEGEWRYGSACSLTSSVDGVGGQRHAAAALPPLHRRLGGVQ
jgi:hypothetical protein